MSQQSLEDLLADRSFIRWIKEESYPKEKEYWDTWLREDPEHQILLWEAKELINTFDNEHKIPDPLTELGKLDRTIDRYEGRRKQLQLHRYEPLYWKNRRTIAAGILLLIACLGSFFAYQSYLGKPEEKNVAKVASVQEYNTRYGEKVTFRLSDGSRIILNAHSSLKFSSKIEKGLNTEVWLEGEAYFDIAHLEGEQQRTFTVHTSDGSIQVLGTRFVVKTFGEETRTVLEEGKISIRVKGNSRESTAEYMLDPGKMARFTTGDNKVAIKEVNTRVYTSWIEDKLVFANTPMKEVARRIEDTFGIDVILKKELAEEHLTGSIKSTNLKVLTEALSEILKAKIEERDQILYIGIDN